MKQFLRATSFLFFATLIVACTSTPKIQTSFDENLNASEFETFNFRSPTAVENADFSESLGLQFTAAMEEQLLVRGFTKAETPDMWLNVFVDLEDKNSAPANTSGISTDGYFEKCPRYGPGSRRSSTGSLQIVCRFKEGSVTIEMTDAESEQTVWTGIANVQIAEDEVERTLKRRGSLLAPVVVDVNSMLEESPFPERQLFVLGDERIIEVN